MNRQLVFNELNNNKICVFHNEVIARYYAIEYASEYGVVESSKAIAYDTFREYFLPSHEGLNEVNNQIRELFLLEFFEENKLIFLINNDYPESINRFTSYLTRILQQLKRLRENIVFNSLEDDFKYDVNLLFDEYSKFLKENNLFEPSFEEPSIEFAPKFILENFYTIIASDTKAGCKKFVDKLGNPNFIKLIDVEKIEEDNCFDNNCNLLTFDNTEELQNNLLRKVKDLLDKNILSRDIAITLCNFDSDISDIEYKAKRYDVPISKAKGYSIIKYPGGKYLKYLSDLYDNNFALEDMKGFFLERSFPFKNIKFNREFIRLAIDANIDHGSNKMESDYWLKRLIRKPEYREYYKKFKYLVILINTCETVSDLKKNLHLLESLLFVEEKGWRESSGEKSYSFALDKLDKIKDAMNICKIVKTKQIFKMFYRLIEKENYVEQGERNGIRIFEYPLSASLDIPYHFVIDINSKNCEVIDKPLSLLPPSIDDQKIREEEDLTTSILKDYCFNSGNTKFLFSYNTYDGAQIAPPIFMEKNSIIKADLDFDNTPFIDELNLWDNKKSLEKMQFTNFQSQSFNKASINVLEFDDNGYVNNNIEATVNNYLVNNIKTYDKNQILNFSSTSINLFEKCPYAFLIKYLYKTKKNEYNVVDYSFLEIGNRIHKIFENFFIKVMEEDGQFYSSNYKKYLEVFEELKEAEFNDYFESELSPPISTQIYIKDRFKNLAKDFLDIEIKVFDTFRSTDMEKSYKATNELQIDGKSYYYGLNGKIDRIINLNNGNYAIVDYKSGHTPVSSTWHKKAYTMEIEALPDYQFPAYKKLLEANNMSVNKATYYSVSSGKYCDMFNETYPGNLEVIDRIFDEVIKDIISNILKGNYKATPSKEHCENCDYRQVCRKRYSTK